MTAGSRGMAVVSGRPGGGGGLWAARPAAMAPPAGWWWTTSGRGRWQGRAVEANRKEAKGMGSSGGPRRRRRQKEGDRRQGGGTRADLAREEEKKGEGKGKGKRGWSSLASPPTRDERRRGRAGTEEDERRRGVSTEPYPETPLRVESSKVETLRSVKFLPKQKQIENWGR